MNKDLAEQLMARSEFYESRGTAARRMAKVQELLSNLGPITTASFGVSNPVPIEVTQTAENVTTPATPSPPAPKTQAVFSTSRIDYRPCLQDPRVAAALAQLQSLRERNRIPGSRIIKPHG